MKWKYGYKISSSMKALNLSICFWYRSSKIDKYFSGSKKTIANKFLKEKLILILQMVAKFKQLSVENLVGSAEAYLIVNHENVEDNRSLEMEPLQGYFEMVWEGIKWYDGRISRSQHSHRQS